MTTFAAVSDINAIMWIFDFYFKGVRVPRATEDFFNRLSSLNRDTM